MKRTTKIFIFLSLFISFLSSAQAAEVYTIDPMHSYVQYTINHLGFSNQTGKWFVKGTIDLDKDKPENSKVNVSIPVASVNSGIPELDKHLKAALFFDVIKFPNATFVSNKIELTGKDSAKIYGTLTLHGMAKPVVLNVKFSKMGKNEITNKMTVGFAGNANIKRSEFGMNALLPSLGDDVNLDIQVEAFKK